MGLCVRTSGCTHRWSSCGPAGERGKNTSLSTLVQCHGSFAYEIDGQLSVCLKSISEMLHIVVRSQGRRKRIYSPSYANTPPRSRGPFRPSSAKSFTLKIRGRRECRVHAAPAVSCAIVRKETHTSIQVQTEHSGIPCAMALRLMPSSPRRRIRLASVAARLTVHRNPVGFENLRQLDTSNGCQDHTVLPYA